MADHYSVITIGDYSEEKSTMKVYNGAITAVSIAGFLTDLGALETATTGLVLGTVQQSSWVGDVNTISSAWPTDPDAQRERKGLVRYHGDTSNDVFTLTIPAIRTKDSGGNSLLLPGTDKFNLAETEVAAWVTAFEQIARNPNDDAETVTVDSITLVGRNL